MLVKFIQEKRRNTRLNNKKLLKTLYHELGHLFVAILHEDILTVNSLVVDKKIAKKKTGQDFNGGLSFSITSSW